MPNAKRGSRAGNDAEFREMRRVSGKSLPLDGFVLYRRGCVELELKRARAIGAVLAK
jgi:hypothetical protein